MKTLAGLAVWYRDLLDEELIAAWRRDNRTNLTEVIEPLADPRVAAGIVEFSWRQQRKATFTPAYAPLLGHLMVRYPDSATLFLDDLLGAAAMGQAPDLSPPETEAVCRILLDMPDIRTFKQSALRILPHYRREVQVLLDQDLHGDDREKRSRAANWLNDLGAGASGPPPAAGNAVAAQVAPFRVGNGVTAPALLFKVEPDYSATGRKLLAQGTVLLHIVVRPDGTAQVLKILRSVGYGLDEKAIECVRKWRFKAGTKDGTPVAVEAQIDVRFGLVDVSQGDYWYSGPLTFAPEAGLGPPLVRDGTMPARARDFSHESMVFEFTVDSKGAVKDIRSIHGSESASKLLTPYLSTWKFQPGVKGNRPVEVTGRVRFIKGQGDDDAKGPLNPPLIRSRAPAPAPAPEKSAPPMDAGKVRTAVNAKDGQRYVWISPGTFTMGCSPGDTECAADEKPPRQERVVNGFWLGQTEVTQAAYIRVTGGNPSFHKGDQLPVERVTWDHAANYCRAIDARLPTEVEWEYAARAGSTWARYGNLDEVAWHSGNGGGVTHPVATKQANAFGLYDMLGNVWEYVADGYSGTADKMLRGGGLLMDLRFTRASSRLRSAPAGSANGRGFRCAGEDPGTQPSVVTAAAVPIRTVVPTGTGQRNSMVNPKDGLVYAWIPPGSFTMGCSQGDTECNDNEKPAHAEENAQGFWLGQTEVTQKAYQLLTSVNPSANKGEALPVENVTWNEANSYCGRIGGHLPTEAEWEYAPRGHAGITPARYGNLDAVAWHSANSGGTNHPVAQKQPNAFGLYDMLGNVWEWVEDSRDGNSILRGGSSEVYPGNVRASTRSVVAPWDSTPNRGFRCAGEWLAPEKTPAGGSAGTAAQPSIPGVYRVGPGVTPPALLRKVEPQYSEKARKAKYQGTVLLYIQIDTNGKAINIRVLHSLGLGLDEKAMEAVKKWKFRPAFKDGKPVVIESQVEVNFRLL